MSGFTKFTKFTKDSKEKESCENHDDCENREECKNHENHENCENIEEECTIIDDQNKAYSDLMDRYQRSLAEFDNFRKRTLKEKAGAYDDAVRDTVEKLLPTLDNFERALSVSEDKENTFYKGIEMIARQLDAYLESLGVEAISSAGEAFDHNMHFAVVHIEDDKYGTNEVVEELQKGYTHKGKVIRPSMVKVAN